jgi:hypothetical protein
VSAPGSHAVIAVVVLALVRTQVAIAPGWSVPLPVLVLAGGLVLSAAVAGLALVLACGFRSSPAWRPAWAAGPPSAEHARTGGGRS